MKYQAIKELKTKRKTLGVYETLQEAHDTIKNAGATFSRLSYMGNFPMYKDDKGYIYTIQGKHETAGIVQSINDEELSAFNFAK